MKLKQDISDKQNNDEESQEHQRQTTLMSPSSAS